MAIIVEEEKNRSNLPSMLGWFVILVVALAAAYYVFFAAPPVAVVVPPAAFQSIAPLAQISFDPQSVVSSTAFQSLRQYVAEPTSTGPTAVGRPNPFVSP